MSISTQRNGKHRCLRLLAIPFWVILLCTVPPFYLRADYAFGQTQNSSLPEYRTSPVSFAAQPREITALGISPDESIVATGDCDGKIRLYDRASQKLKRIASGHTDVVSAIGFSPDGTRLVSAGFDSKIKVWNTTDLSDVMSFRDKSAITDIVLSPDGATLVTCGYDKIIRFRNLATGQEFAALDDHQATVRCLAYSPDGKFVLSGGDDETLRLWAAKTQKPVRTIESFEGRIRDVGFSSTGQYFAGLDEGGLLRIFSTTDAAYDHKFSRVIPGWRLTFAESDSIIAGYANGEVRSWHLTDEKKRTSLFIGSHSDSISGIAYLKTDRSILTTGLDGDIARCVARLPAEAPIARIRTGTRVWDSAMTPHGNLLATAGRGGIVELRELKTGNLIRTLDAHRTTADRVQFSGDGSLVATAGWKSTEIVVRRVADGESIQTLDAEANVRDVAFSPNGNMIAAACENGHLMAFRLKDGERIANIAAHTMKIHDVAWSPDGKTILTSEGDWGKDTPGTTKVWNANSFKELRAITGHKTGIAAVVFRPDGQQAATAARSGRIKIWDLKSYRQLASLGPKEETVPKSTTRIRSIEYSPNGKHIAAAMYDGTVNLWDVADRKLIRRFRGDNDMFTVRFSPDGSVMCGASGKWDVLFWDISDLNPGPTADWIRNWGQATPKDSK